MSPERIRNIVEAALLAAGRPLSLDSLMGLFQPAGSVEQPGEGETAETVEVASAEGGASRDEVRAALDALAVDYRERGIELKEVSSGYRIQVRPDHAEALRTLWSERPARYSRALLETLALIAYRQPITRGEIEDIRGVSVSSSIVKTLLEREWVRVVGHRDVPGKPAMYGTTRRFLDYFSLRSLAELPTLAEIRDIDDITGDLFPSEAPPAQVRPGDGHDAEASAPVAAEATDSDPDEAAGEPAHGAAPEMAPEAASLASPEPEPEANVEEEPEADEAPATVARIPVSES